MTNTTPCQSSQLAEWVLGPLGGLFSGLFGRCTPSVQRGFPGLWVDSSREYRPRIRNRTDVDFRRQIFAGECEKNCRTSRVQVHSVKELTRRASWKNMAFCRVETPQKSREARLSGRYHRRRRVRRITNVHVRSRWAMLSRCLRCGGGRYRARLERGSVSRRMRSALDRMSRVYRHTFGLR